MKKERTTKKVQHQEEKNLTTKNKSSKIFFIVAIILIAMFSLALTPVTLQNDTYYTIEIGKQIMETGIDMQDHFSWVIPFFRCLIFDQFLYFIQDSDPRHCLICNCFFQLLLCEILF